MRHGRRKAHPQRKQNERGNDMYVIKCEGFREEKGYNTGGLLWDIKMLEIDMMQSRHEFDSGVKELFYGLAKCGEVKTVSAGRAAKVQGVLTKHNYIVALGY
jgi:hypothetical protein